MSDDAKRDPEQASEREPEGLYFFPDEKVTEAELRQILAGEDEGRKAWAVSHLLRYAEWADIWLYVTRDEVRDVFGRLDLPPNLRTAWARHLKIEAPVG